MKNAIVFPGQGSQQAGMGLDLFKKYPDETDNAAAILGYRPEEVCAESGDPRLHQTEYTQPLLYLTCALAWKEAAETGTGADVFAGHSLGEYVALHASGAFDLGTGLRLVQERGRLMSQARGGAMGAVIGLLPEKISEVLQTSGFDKLAPANFNSYDQTVISGDADQIAAAGPALKSAGAKLYKPLQVSAAFHSIYMRPAEEAFRSFLAEFTLATPQTPVISNFTAQAYTNENLKENLARQISGPVRWVESVETMLDLGVAEFTEIGPGQVLTKLIGQIRKRSGR